MLPNTISKNHNENLEIVPLIQHLQKNLENHTIIESDLSYFNTILVSQNYICEETIAYIIDFIQKLLSKEEGFILVLQDVLSYLSFFCNVIVRRCNRELEE